MLITKVRNSYLKGEKYGCQILLTPTSYLYGNTIMMKPIKLPSKTEFEKELKEAGKWAKSVGYEEDDVSGDKDLLDLKKFEGIEIVTAKEFYEKYVK